MKASVEAGQLIVEGRVPSGSSHSQVYERAGQIMGKDVWFVKTLYSLALKIKWPKYVTARFDLNRVLGDRTYVIRDTPGIFFLPDPKDPEGRTVVLFYGEGPYEKNVEIAFRAMIEDIIEDFRRPFREEYQHRIKNQKVSYTKVSQNV